MNMRIELKGFKELMNRLEDYEKNAIPVCNTATAKAARFVRDEAKRNCRAVPRIYEKTGRTVNKIRAAKLSGWWGGGVVMWGVGGSRIGMFMELGTRRHPIAVKKARVLARTDIRMKGGYVITGGLVFGRQVSHPGAPSRPWLGPALEQNVTRIIETMRVALENSMTSGFGNTAGTMVEEII